MMDDDKIMLKEKQNAMSSMANQKRAHEANKGDGAAKAQAGRSKKELATQQQQAADNNKGEDDEAAAIDEFLAVPTNLERQTGRTMRPSQPGAVAIAGIGGENAPTGSDNQHHHHTPPSTGDESTVKTVEDDLSETVPLRNDLNDEVPSSEHLEDNQSTSLPVATVVQAQLVDGADLVEKLSEKERELKELTEKLKDMENLKKEVEDLRKKVSTAVPAKKVSLDEEAPKPTKRVGPKQLSQRERHAMKILVGDPSSTDFSNDFLIPPPSRRHHSDTVVPDKLPEKSLQRSDSSEPGFNPSAQPEPVKPSSNRSATTATPAMPAPGEANSCCVIL